jgi:hypothetical protein
MLPSRGCCHAVFLLVYSASLKTYSTLDDWVAAAKNRSTIMAAALNLSTVARSLVALNLATIDPVIPAKSLRAAGDHASLQTFEKIARIILERCPPPWLKVAVSDIGVSREYIPAADLEALSWLGDALDQILMDVFRSVGAEDDQIAKAIGDAAELIVLAALRQMEGSVLHVAQISDAFGYDIEHRRGAEVYRIEVKACSALTSDKFILSRNEFDKSQALSSEWKILQVVFKAGAVFGSSLGAEDVIQIRELTPEALIAICAPDSGNFRWRESAEFRPKPEDWTPCHLDLDPSFKVPLRSMASNPGPG